MAVKFSLASPQTHQVPQVNFPHTDPAKRVDAVKITPDFALATALESHTLDFF